MALSVLPDDRLRGHDNGVHDRMMECAGHVLGRSGRFERPPKKIEDTLPLFPDDPYIAANRRVTITLMHEPPPIPANFRP